MGHSAEKRFEQRFTRGIEVIYRARPWDGEEKQFHQQNVSSAVKAVLTAVLHREPKPEELLGIIPVVVSEKERVV